MATLFDGIVTEGNVWRGAARFLYADSGTSFPGEMESVIHPNTYVLANGWNDFGGTSEDGLTLTREFEGSDGVPIDQRAYNLFEGDPTRWMMKVAATLMETDPDNLSIAWELPTATDVTGSVATSQKKLVLDAPITLVKRMVAAVQEHPSGGNLRVVVFRIAALAPGAKEMIMTADTGSGVPIELNCKADPDVANDDGPFGVIFRETA